MGKVWNDRGVQATFPPVVLAVLVFTSLMTLGSGPRQGGLPPQPFFADSVSGSVTLQGKPAPPGAKLVACIDDCGSVFESAPILLSNDGSFLGLKVDPKDQRLVGHQIGFYLMNEFGRICASETVVFQGAAEMFTVDLTFPPGHARTHRDSYTNAHCRFAIAGRPGGYSHPQSCFGSGRRSRGGRGFLAVPGQAAGLLAEIAHCRQGIAKALNR